MSKTSLPLSFCVFGGALIDRVGIFETIYHPGQSHPGHWQQTVGGVAANVARHLAHFGAKVTFASVFSDDIAALTVRSRLEDDGLTIIPDCTISGGATPTYTVMHDPSGDVIAGLADMALHDHMNVAWARKAALADMESTHWIADTNIAPAGLAELASLKGDKSLYLVVVSPAKTEGLAPLLPYLDGIVCNRQEAEALTGATSPDALSAATELAATGLPFCIVSDGAKAAALAHKPPGHTLQLIAVEPAVSTEEPTNRSRLKFRLTGAGDMFAAACLFALCDDAVIAPENILQLGHAAARLAMLEDDTCPAVNWTAVTKATHKESTSK